MDRARIAYRRSPAIRRHTLSGIARTSMCVAVHKVKVDANDRANSSAPCDTTRNVGVWVWVAQSPINLTRGSAKCFILNSNSANRMNLNESKGVNFPLSPWWQELELWNEPAVNFLLNPGLGLSGVQEPATGQRYLHKSMREQVLSHIVVCMATRGSHCVWMLITERKVKN